MTSRMSVGVSQTSLGSSRVDVKSQEESGTSSITLKSLGTSGDQHDRCTVSRTSLVTSRKAVKSL